MLRLYTISFAASIINGSCIFPGGSELYTSTERDEYYLIWEEDFNDNSLDLSKWNIVTGDGCPELCGWGNNELQFYTENEENIRVENGHLIIEAHKQGIDKYDFTSAKITTQGKESFKYGKIEVRARLPYGKGTWPAVWLLPEKGDSSITWPNAGEIDIMEHVGYNQGIIYGTVHTKSYNGMLETQLHDSIYIKEPHNQFHVYAMEWSEDALIWFVDDVPYHRLERSDVAEEDWPFNDFRYHIIINLAVGGNWGGRRGIDHDIWPQKLTIDYVKYYTAYAD